MSADNYYIIRKHPNGKFVGLMGFASDGPERTVNVDYEYYTFYESYEEARRWAEAQYSEYDVRVHPECYAEENCPVCNQEPPQESLDLHKELTSLLNRYSAENVSGTPDFILAEYLFDCIKAFNGAVVKRADWRGESTELPALSSLRS